MVNFPAEFSRRAAKYINKVGGKRILEKIDKLEENPFPQEVES